MKATGHGMKKDATAPVDWGTFSELANLCQQSIFALGKKFDELDMRLARFEAIVAEERARKDGANGMVVGVPASPIILTSTET